MSEIPRVLSPHNAVPKKSWEDEVAESESKEVTYSESSSKAEEKVGEISETESKKSYGDNGETEVPSQDKSVPELKVENLNLEDNNKINRFSEGISESNCYATETEGNTPYTSVSKFEDLNLSPELLKGLYTEMKFKKPSQIQARTLPMILNPPYKNLAAQAHNGSGKTTCFVLGMLSRVDPSVKRPQAICVCPTRELANQNSDVVERMGKYTATQTRRAIPTQDARHLPVTEQLVIGTPGTILKLISNRKLGTSHIKMLVFDEADQMLAEQGFQDDSMKILKFINKESSCQVLLFSATFSDTVQKFVGKIMKDYNHIFLKKEELTLSSVKQYRVYLPDEISKVEVIKDSILELGDSLGQIIIFVNLKRSASELHKTLVKEGYEVTTTHGALTHEDRDKIVSEFKSGLTQVLISTDVLSRGFDQQQVNLVVNYDLPVNHEMKDEPNYEVYLHRVGRAGRFGRQGAAINLLMHDRDEMIMKKIMEYFNVEVIEISSQDPKGIKTAFEEAGVLQAGRGNT